MINLSSEAGNEGKGRRHMFLLAYRACMILIYINFQ